VGDLWFHFLQNPSDTSLNKQWSGATIVADYFGGGLPAKAHFSPGKGIHYADTNFVLLALAAEKLTGKSLAENCRERILDPLGMKQTYLEWYEPKRGDRLAHHFLNFGSQGGGNVDVVAAKLNTSADWAGGGLVSTVEDLNVFVRAIFSGKLFQHKATLEEMTKPLGTLPDGSEYGLGLMKSTTEAKQHAYWGHAGFWGVGMFYCPANNVSVVFCRNQPADIGKELNIFDEVLDEVGLFR
jgi:D-alanyl-D-alanine carboxypeptidase